MSRKAKKRSDFGPKLLARKERVPAGALKPLVEDAPLGSRLAARFARLTQDIPAPAPRGRGTSMVLKRCTISLTPEDSAEIARRAAQIGLSVPHTIEAMLRGVLNLTRLRVPDKRNPQTKRELAEVFAEWDRCLATLNEPGTETSRCSF